MAKLEVDHEKLINDFEALPNDTERWAWVREHQHTGVIVKCDNDDTFIIFPDDTESQFIGQFDHFVGWADGQFSLFEAFGVIAELA